MKRIRWRVMIPASLAILAAVAAVAAFMNLEWVEEFIGVSPDGGSGEFELALPVALLACAFISAVLAGWQWRVGRTRRHLPAVDP